MFSEKQMTKRFRLRPSYVITRSPQEIPLLFLIKQYTIPAKYNSNFDNDRLECNGKSNCLQKIVFLFVGKYCSYTTMKGKLHTIHCRRRKLHHKISRIARKS